MASKGRDLEEGPDRWMDSVRSDMKEHQLDPKLAQHRETWTTACVSDTQAFA